MLYGMSYNLVKNIRTKPCEVKVHGLNPNQINFLNFKFEQGGN